MIAPSIRPPAEPGFSGSYPPEDVTFLLKPVDLRATEVAEKERLIQSGRRHYSEMIAPESPPGPAYMALYEQALARNGGRLADDIAALAKALADRAAGRPEIVIASLARAGTPIGVLLRRAVERLGIAAVHYSISIIRDRGLDEAGLAHIAARHDPSDVVFVDGWTGKGAIAGELHRSLAGCPLGFRPWLAVIADPAGRADLAATEEDYLIPSGLLNCVVSGLVSRSILNSDLVGPGEFHACVYYPQYSGEDVSAAFVAVVDGLAATRRPRPLRLPQADRAARCDEEMAGLMARFAIEDRNRIKPGIAEATRAVLRRVPDRLLLRDPADPDVRHLVHLAREKGLEVELLDPQSSFRAVSIIRELRPR
ncbi:MAG TPA: cysteine protease StiP family protein [Allosphingosinicella sp.]|nr:cysteine protease StiP family protein [Allosphingosinicella sp.]